jgi:hypothetical protein
MWLCSHSLCVVESEVSSELLRETLGWKAEIDVKVLVEQLKALSGAYDAADRGGRQDLSQMLHRQIDGWVRGHASG